MTTAAAPHPTWTPLAALAGRFAANVAALATRDPGLAGQLRATAPAEPYAIRAAGDGVAISVGGRDVPCRVTPAVAAATAAGLFPTGWCDQPLLVAGEDLGWLWDRLCRLPCRSPTVPGWRPPLFLVLPDVERLWMLLHLHDWREPLADARVRIHAGPDAAARLADDLSADPQCPLPQRWVTIDATVCPGGTTIEGLLAGVTAGRVARQQQLAAATVHLDGAAAIVANRPLRVLGITSRYTTFLQHSMRDWLAAFDRLGHTTRLLIESADHQVGNSLATAEACAAFGPDLVVAIDHLRYEHGTAVPPGVPFVGWVQDAMPHLHTAEAGRAQGALDYAIGFGRARLTSAYCYPPARFMSCNIPANDARFRPDGPVDPGLACDVAFVSHASATAEALFAAAVDGVTDPAGRAALRLAFDRLAAVYAAGGSMTEPPAIMRLVDGAFAERGAVLSAGNRPALVELYVQRLNNALFRHQSLAWVAGLGVDLRLYGNGWDQHPTLARFARGPITNPDHLAAVHRSSRIGLQISPFGTVHQRVFEALAAGGFFLLRAVPGDVVERDYQPVWQWCQANGIATDADVRARATPDVTARIASIGQAWQMDPFDMHVPLVDLLRISAEDGYQRSAGAIFGDDYDAVAFGSADELARRVATYLGDPDARRRRAGSMRRSVADRFTYVALTRQLLEFIAGDLRSRQHYRTAA